MPKRSKRATKKQLKKHMLGEQEAACDVSEEPLSTFDEDLDLDAHERAKEAGATEKKDKPQSMDDFLATFGEDVDVEGEDDLGEDLANGTSSSDEEHESDDDDDDAKFDLEKVKETDPEFYQYMIKNDPSFANSSKDNISEEQSSESSDEGVDEKRSVSEELVERLEEEILSKCATSALRQYLLIYQSCCYITDQTKAFYKIESSSLFNRIIQFALTNLVNKLNEKFDLTDVTFGSKRTLPNEKNGFAKLEKAIKSFLISTIYFVDQLTDSGLRCFVLSAVERLTPYFSCFEIVSKKLLKLLLQFWVSSDETTRICAFAAIRQLLIDVPAITEDILRSSYLHFLRHSKVMSRATSSVITFLINCVTELYALKPKDAYQFAFVYMRQLAVYLRQAYIKPTTSHLNVIKNWQFLNGLRLWTSVLTDERNPPLLRQLVHPLIQLLCGEIEMTFSFKTVPIQLKAIEYILDLAQNNHVFLSVSKYLIAILNLSEMKLKPKKETSNIESEILKKLPKSDKNRKSKKERKLRQKLRQKLLEKMTKQGNTEDNDVDIDLMVKIPNDLMRNEQIQKQVFARVNYLFSKALSMIAYHPSFPFVILPLRAQLKDIKQLRELRAVLKANAEYIKEKCTKIAFKPTDEQQLDAFLKKEKEAKEAPLDQYYSKLEEKKVAEETEKLEKAADENMFTESTANTRDAADGFIPDAKRKKAKKENADGKEAETGGKKDSGKRPQQSKTPTDAEVGDFSDLMSDDKVDDKAREILSKLGYDDTKLSGDEGAEDGNSSEESESDFDEADYDVYEEGGSANGKAKYTSSMKNNKRKRRAPRKGAKKTSK